MKILAIETSCDDTCVAILEASKINKKPFFNVLSNIVSSQVKIHKKWGGIVPMLAKREHQKNLVPILTKALKEAGLIKKLKTQILNLKTTTKNSKLGKILEREQELFKKLQGFLKKYAKPEIDAIAVTIGPGLEPSLWVGVNFAKALSYIWNMPIIPINHIEAHIAANWLEPIGGITSVKFPISKKIFPALCLVTSGGHTQLILMKKIGKYKLIGETRDDAAGECFDKAARILNLGYPGGPVIAALAAMTGTANLKSQKSKIKTTTKNLKIILPRPMLYSKDYDFSFSGLKTAVLYDFKSRPKKIKKSGKYIQAMCAEVQQAIIDVLISKTLRAAKEYKACPERNRRVKTIMLGGGVAANDELRKQFADRLRITDYSKLNFLVPPKNLCTDNAAMAAVAGYFNRNKKSPWRKTKAKANLRITN